MAVPIVQVGRLLGPAWQRQVYPSRPEAAREGARRGAAEGPQKVHRMETVGSAAEVVPADFWDQREHHTKAGQAFLQVAHHRVVENWQPELRKAIVCPAAPAVLDWRRAAAEHRLEARRKEIAVPEVADQSFAVAVRERCECPEVVDLAEGVDQRQEAAVRRAEHHIAAADRAAAHQGVHRTDSGVRCAAVDPGQGDRLVLPVSLTQGTLYEMKRREQYTTIWGLAIGMRKRSAVCIPW